MTTNSAGLTPVKRQVRLCDWLSMSVAAWVAAGVMAFAPQAFALGDGSAPFGEIQSGSGAKGAPSQAKDPNKPGPDDPIRGLDESKLPESVRKRLEAARQRERERRDGKGDDSEPNNTRRPGRSNQPKSTAPPKGRPPKRGAPKADDGEAEQSKMNVPPKGRTGRPKVGNPANAGDDGKTPNRPKRGNRNQRSTPKSGQEPAGAGGRANTARNTPNRATRDSGADRGRSEPASQGKAINLPPVEDVVPAEERMYAVTFEDVTYEQLLEGVNRLTGLAILGESPRDGKVSFVSDEEISFEELLRRVRELLYEYKPHDPYWMRRTPTGLKVVRISDEYRNLPPSRIYSSVDAYRADKLAEDEIALVKYTPNAGSVSKLAIVRDFMPDYVRIAPFEGENAITIFAVVRDIEKYLELIDRIIGSNKNDIRPLEVIPVENVAASLAWESIQALMAVEAEGRRGGSRGGSRGGRGGESPLGNIPEPEVSVVPDDNQGVLIVRAMQDKIDEIKMLLTVIDVDTGVSFSPIVVPLKHVLADDIIPVIESIIQASGDGGGDSGSSARPRSRGSKRKGKRKASSGGSVSATADGITLISHPSGKAIVVVGPEDTQEEVKQLVEQFDVASDDKPRFIALKYSDPADIEATITTLMAGSEKGAQTNFTLVADANSNGLWYRGSEDDFITVTELVASIDVEASEVGLHVVRLKTRLPSFVVSVLQSFDTTGGSSSGSGGGKGSPRRRGKSVSAGAASQAGKFTPDDENMRLFILCTQEEWEGYKPIIDELEAEVEQPPAFVTFPIEYCTPAEALQKLQSLMDSGEPKRGKPAGGAIRFTTADDAIIVAGASRDELERITELLKIVCVERERITRTFEIQFINPEEMMGIIEELASDGGDATAAPRGRRKPGETATVSSSGMTIVPVGKKLVIRTDPQKMEEVAKLIEEFDIETGATSMRIFNDFPPGTDVEALAENVRSFTLQGKQKLRGKDEPQGPQIVPQPESGRIVVVAGAKELAEIEEIIEVLKTERTVPAFVTELVDVYFADPGEVVELVAPILEMRVNQLIAEGQLTGMPTPPSGGGKARPGRVKRGGEGGGGAASTEWFHMDPDPRQRRVVVTAPQIVIDHAVTIIKQFDDEGVTEDMIEKLIELENTSATDMVKTISELMGNKARGAGAKRAKGGRAQGEVATGEFSIAEVGSNLVFLRGMPELVEQAAGWVEQFDSRATAPSKEIRVFNLECADPKQVTDFIVNTVQPTDEKPGRRKGAPIRPRGRGGRGQDDEEEEDEWVTKITRAAGDIYIEADLIADQLIVSATSERFIDIASIIEQFDDCENNEQMGISKKVPSFTYELKFAKDALNAAWDLESVLSDLWPYEETPKVSSAFWADVLIIEYPHEEHFPEIVEFIEKYIDKPAPEDTKPKRMVLSGLKGLSPEDVARMLRDQNPNIKVKIIDRTEKKESDFPNIDRINPCVTSASLNERVSSFMSMLASVDAALMQAGDPPSGDDSGSPTPPEREIRNETRRVTQPKRSAENPEEEQSAGESKPRSRAAIAKSVGGEESPEVTIYYDLELNQIVIEGAQTELDQIEETFELLKEEAEESGEGPPDIRVYRVKHIDVNTAAAVLDQMFNATRQQRQQAQRAAQQAQRQRQAQERAAQQRGRRNQNQEEDDRRGGRRQAEQQRQPQAPQLPPTSVRIYPNERDRTLILRADATQYPAILELLSIIDRPKPIESTFKTFQLKKLNATEVESLLETMLGLDVPRRRARTGAGNQAQRRGGNQRRSAEIQPGQNMPMTITTPTVDGTAVLGVDPSDIKISSNEDANTLLVMAPEAAIERIGEIIQQLEEQNDAERVWQSWELNYAEAGEVVEYLESYFGGGKREGRREGGGGLSASGLNAPAFVSYPRLNMVSAQGSTEQLDDINKQIQLLDIRGESSEWETVPLAKADAAQVAEQLTQMFSTSGGSSGGKRRRGGGSGDSGAGPEFVGEEGSRILFYSAPEAMREEILSVVEQIEATAVAQTKPRIIELKFAKPTTVAEAIQSAYGSNSGGKRGRANAQFSITGHDPSERLFVVADDETFKEIASLAVTLDKAPKPGFDFRVFPLVHADAKKVYGQLSNLMKDYLTQVRGQGGTEPFSAEVDQKSNSLVVLGSPAVFGFLEENLRKIDIPANAKSPPGFLMVALENAVAQEVAQNINKLWSDRNLPDGETPPQAEANRSTNTLIVKGTQAQIDEIKKQFVDPLEQNKVPNLITETFQLEHAQPEEVAETINKIFEDKRRVQKEINKDKGSPIDFVVVATPDVVTRQVIVQAGENNLEFIRNHISVLDRPENAVTTAVSMRVYPIKYAEPGSVANIITQWARERNKGRKNVSASEMVTAVAENGTRSVVVTASEGNHLTIKSMIDDLDDESVATRQRQKHVLTLKYTSAGEVTNHFNQIFRNATRRRGDPGPSFVADRNSNAVIASVNEEEMVEVESLLTTLDVEPPLDATRSTEVYTLKYADPGSLNNVVLNMFRWDRRGEASPAEQVTCAADWGTRSLIVTASTKNHAIVSAMIEKADVESALKKEDHIYQLQNADAASIEQTLRNALQSRRRTGRGEQPVNVVADVATNKLIITATATEYEEMKSLIEALDTEEAMLNEVRVVPLTFADANELQRALSETRQKPGGGGRRGGGELVGGVRIAALPQGNALVLSGPKTEIEELAAQVEEMDTQGALASAPREFKLVHAPMDRVVPALQEMFVDGGGRGGRGGRRGQQPPVITGLQANNSILVKASPQEMSDIETMIATLDT
ncbi:MAG: secretin N-terminal domain-containing protein, partial [Phycisphaerae bacterium]